MVNFIDNTSSNTSSNTRDIYIENTSHADFIDGLSYSVKNINFILVIFLFIIGMIIFSDISVNFLSNFGYVEDGIVNSEGTMLQVGIFVLSYVFLDLMRSSKYI